MSDQTIAPPPAAPPGVAAPRAEARAKPGRLASWLASWNWRAHPPGWAVFNLTILLGWVTWKGHDIGLPPVAALIVGGIGAAAAAGNAMIGEQGPTVIWWRVACWIVPALWAVNALTWSPFQPYVFCTALGLALAAYLFASAIRTARRTATQVALDRAGKSVGLTGQALQLAPADAVWVAADPDATDETALAVNWEARLRRVCHVKSVQILRVGMWSQKTGYTLTVKLPLGGTSWRDIANFAEALAEDAALPPDCGITVKPSAERRGLAEIQVVHRNMMAEDHPAPRDYSPTSIYERAPIGILPDGALIRIAFKWIWFVVTGQTDAGKSSMLHLVTLHFARCVDALPWHIDIGGGGGMSRPWVTPWYEGRTPHPIVDWVATTEEEANLMCDAAIAIVEGRKRHYANQMDNGKIQCSPDLPHIVVMSDETASLSERLKGKLIIISQQGRASGVRGGTGVLRATAEDLPTALKKHARFRIGMRVSDRDEIGYLFDTPGRVDPELARWQGSGWIENQDEDADGNAVGRKYLTPFKALFLSDAQIAEAAAAAALYQPALDAPSVALADSVSRTVRAYTDRWERTLPTLFVVDEPAAGPAAPIDAERAAKIAAAEARQAELHATGGSIDDRLARLNELGAAIADGATEDGSPTEVDSATVAELTGGLSEDNLVAVLTVVDRAGAQGIGPAEILRTVNAARAEADRITDKTIQRKLGELVYNGFVIKAERGRYVAAINTDQEGPTDVR